MWAAAAALGPRDASVLDLHLRHGLAPAEIAEELGVTANTAHQVLFRLRARLGDAVRACVLWRAGHPACPELAGAVAAAGIAAFGADAVAGHRRPRRRLRRLRRRQEGRLSPEALFAAVPLLVVAPEVLAAIRPAWPTPACRWADARRARPRPRPVASTDGSAGGRGTGTAGPSGGGCRPGDRRRSRWRPGCWCSSWWRPSCCWATTAPIPRRSRPTARRPRPRPTEPRSRPTDGRGLVVDLDHRGPAAGGVVAPLPDPVLDDHDHTAPNADIGTVPEPGFAPNPTTTPRPTGAADDRASAADHHRPPAPDPPTIISFTATRDPRPGLRHPVRSASP